MFSTWHIVFMCLFGPFLPLKAVEKKPLSPQTLWIFGFFGWIFKVVDSFATVRSTFKMLLKDFRNYIRPHADIYQSDLSFGDGSRPTESDLATRQTPNEGPLCERQTDFPFCVFSTSSTTSFRSRAWLRQSRLSSLICEQVGTGGQALDHSSGIGWTAAATGKVPAVVSGREDIKTLSVTPSLLL